MKMSVAVAALAACWAATWSVSAGAQQPYYVQPNGYYYPNQYVPVNPGYVSTYPNNAYGQAAQNGAAPQFTVPGAATAMVPIGPPVSSSVPLGQQSTLQQPSNALRQDTSQQVVRPPSVGGSAGSYATSTQKDPRGMQIEGTAKVVDGDTFMVDQQMVTLYGADAPEMEQLCHSHVMTWRCGIRAKEELAKLIEGRQVSCVGQRQAGDAVAAQCTIPTGDVADQMVRSGFAVVPWELVREYLPAQEMAKGAARGVWAGEFEWPWDFRNRSQMVKLTR